MFGQDVYMNRNHKGKGKDHCLLIHQWLSFQFACKTHSSVKIAYRKMLKYISLRWNLYIPSVNNIL